MAITPQQLASVAGFDGLARLFHDAPELDWPTPEWSTFTGVAPLYGITDIPGVQSLAAVQKLDSNQRWGIFLVDFGTNRLRRSDLRRILTKVAEKARQTHGHVTWPHDNILFVCRSEQATFTLGHFAGDKPANAKLRTFGWSDPHSARTLLTRNLPHLAWSNQDRWHEAWDVEKLTKDFYSRYREVFEATKAMVVHPGSDEQKHLFVQSLFNRLMFVAFIEKMGWLELNGSNDYLHTLYQRYLQKPHRHTPTFYSVLEYLFFSGLNCPNGIGGGHKLEPILGKVPYLNGGLFERDAVLDVAGIVVPDAVFQNILADHGGLFRSFNFTVMENTPLDVDVAVDPEMLGKIFEELVTGRHESGSYYTPRPVVSFMCREALKGYLGGGEAIEKFVDEHDATLLADPEAVLEKLRTVKACDPACGSGAYLLGMLQELIALRRCLFAAKNVDPVSDYRRKLEIIQENLYGVDIDPFAVSIARLRLWLSLAVDFEGDKPEPLPNLDYKIEVGDSVLGPQPVPEERVVNKDMFRQEQIQRFAALKAEYAHPTDEVTRQELKQRIGDARTEIATWVRPTTGQDGFDWLVDFAEVFLADGGGFDIVVANPPYVRQELIKHLKPALQKVYPETYCGTADLYCYFYLRSMEILRPGGMLAFISSNKWFRAKYGANLRKYMAENARILSITDFGELPVFETSSTFPMIFIAQKGGSGVSPDGTPAEHRRDGETTTPRFTQVKSLEEPYPDVLQIIRRDGHVLPPDAIRGEDWRLTDSATLAMLDKMESAGIPLGEYVQGRIYRGILTGCNAAFVIDGAKRAELIAADPKSEEIIKPLAVGDDIRRWRIERKDRWLIFMRHGTDPRRYPAIMDHLAQFRKELKPRPRDWDEAKHGHWPGRKPGSYEWYEIQDTVDYYPAFEQPKIVYQEIATYQRFAMDGDGCYVNNKVFLIPLDDWYLLAILNAEPSWQFLAATAGRMIAGAHAMQTPYLSRLPVPAASPADRRSLVQLAQRCAKGDGEDLGVVEAEIDDRVAKLYGL